MKKIIAAALTAITLAVSAVTAPVYAAFSDVDEKNPYRNAVTTLSTLSVIDGYEDGTFKPDGTITRAEFTKLLVFMLGLQDITYQTYTFPDVADTHWAANYIQTGYDRNIISGFEDGTFRAEEPVTYAQALKMVVCTLGYEDFAMGLNIESEGWADKYIQEAGSLGLTKNVSGSSFYDGATRGMVAQILYNALEIEMYENNGYNWVRTEKTLMGDYLKVKELKGTLVGVEDTVTEDCTVDLLEDQLDILDNSGEEILIDYSGYTDSSLTLTKYLGNTITVYYRQLNDNDERRLISIDDETTKNSVLELDHNDLSSFSGNTLKYYDESSKSKNVKLKTDDLTVRYNGKLVTASETVELDGQSYTRQEALEQWLTTDTGYTVYGSIKLTDNGDDGTYDMIQIYDYETMVALSSPSTTDYRITDKLVTGNYIILDPQSASYTYTITKDGAEIPVTSIASNDIVLYAKSLDDERYTVLVGGKTVTGTVTSVSSDGKQITIMPSGTGAQSEIYNLGDQCVNYILKNNSKELKAGVNGTFYVDSLGTVVYGTITETAAAPYAYITNTYMEDGKYYITVYAPSISGTETMQYPLKSTVRVNGSNLKAEPAQSRIKSAAQYATDETELASKIYGAGREPANLEFAQPARVQIKSGEVTDIVLLTSGDLAPQNEDKEQITKGRELDEYTYANNSFTLDGKTSFSVNSSTIVIYVPMDRSSKKGYARKAPSAAFTSNERYYLEAYDLNSSRTAGLVIVYGADGTLTKVKKDSDFSLVADTQQEEYNSTKDEVEQKVEVYTGSSNVTKKWATYDAKEFSDVQPGDVIQFAYDSDSLIQGRINNIKYADIAKVLDGDETNNGQLYNWEAELTPSEENNMQSMKFDYRFKKAGTSEDELYSSSTLGMVPYSRAVVFNVSQVLTDEKKLYVTKGGFTDIDGTMVIDDDSYEEITIASSTKILRMEDERDEISRYVDDTTTDLTINDLRDAKNYGTDCSKILVFMSKGSAKLIVILH